ncbi:MAG: LPS export ABC transporter periplasmic protein LptC [Pseudomonadota bacterium]|nr:LPS export ABC transporter periplasmic protein LptC [Pseudomonadota bacterium]
MTINIKKHFGLALLMIATFGSWIFSKSIEVKNTNQVEIQERVENRFYLNSTKILNTGNSGIYLFTLEADYAEQETDYLIKFYDVKIAYTPESRISWHLTASTAVKKNNEDFFVLEGNVVATNSKAAQERTIIYSEKLRIDPKTYQVNTDTQVNIKLGDHDLSAKGMVAILNENKLELKSEINGTFLPPALL